MDRRCLLPLAGLLVAISACRNDATEIGDDDVGSSTSAGETEGGSDEGSEGGGEIDGESDTAGETEDGSVPAPPMVVEEVVHRPVPGAWPSAAFGADQYLVVWEDHRRPRPVLYGGRITADGTALDPLGFPILDAVPTSEALGTYQPAVAFDGKNHLVVVQVGKQIRGVRVGPAGDVLDPEDFAIATLKTGGLSRPSLAFDGEQYLVAWSQWVNENSDDNGVHRARVTPDGSVLDPNGVKVDGLGYSLSAVGVSFDGGNYLLSSESLDAETNAIMIAAARIAPDGTQIDKTPLHVSPPSLDIFNDVGTVAGFDGTNHVIAWVDGEISDTYQVFVNRVTPDGTVLDPQGIEAIVEPGEGVNVHRLDLSASKGHSIVVLSTDYAGEGGPGARAIRVVAITAEGTTSPHPADDLVRGLEAIVAAHPDGALLLRRAGDHIDNDYPAIVGTRLDASGVLVPDSVVTPASPASRQDVKGVASDGTNFLVVWTDTRDPQADGRALYASRVAADGTPLDAGPILITTMRAELADVVFDGANYVVTWVRNAGGEGEGTPYRVVRVSPAGEVLDAEPLQPPLNSMEGILSASNGEGTLLLAVNWPNELTAVHMDHDGGIGGGVPILDEGYPWVPAVASDGTGYLVAWYDDSQHALRGQRISQQGALEGPTFSIVSWGGVHEIEIDFGIDTHLVTWKDDAGIWATHVSSDGQVLDPDGQLILALQPEWWAGMSVAFDGENFLVAWQGSLDLHAAWVSPELEVLAKFPVSEQPEREGLPFLAGGDGRVLAAWSRFVPGTPYDTRRAITQLFLP